jgi:hypothetical protein
MEDGPIDFEGLIDASGKDYWAGPPLTEEMVRAAEERLGYRLPETYLRLLRVKNGVTLRLERSRFPVRRGTPYASDYVGINGILGIGHPRGIDGERGSRFMIDEWGYPDVGVYFGATPGGGHTALMLDYSACGPRGEPRVIYALAGEVEGEESRVISLAPDFDSFLRGLRGPDEFDD